MIKKWDIILIVFMIIISFIPEMIFFSNKKKEYNSKHIEISIDGKIDRKIPLLDTNMEQKIEISTNNGINILKVVNGEVQVIEADCSDEVCINFGSISKVGENIVCLPHKLVVSIKGDADEDDMILSY